jgi:hypothetical protein
MSRQVLSRRTALYYVASGNEGKEASRQRMSTANYSNEPLFSRQQAHLQGQGNP